MNQSGFHGMSAKGFCFRCSSGNLGDVTCLVARITCEISPKQEEKIITFQLTGEFGGFGVPFLLISLISIT